MKNLLVGSMCLFSFSTFAADFKCNIVTAKDAQNCMDKVALNHVEYNLPNIGSSSTQKGSLVKVLQSLGLKVHKSIKTADFVGVLLEKGDEWNLYYFTLTKGKFQRVVPVGNINLVDLSDSLTIPLTVSDLLLGDKNKKFDTEDRGWVKDYLDLE